MATSPTSTPTYHFQMKVAVIILDPKCAVLNSQNSGGAADAGSSSDRSLSLDVQVKYYTVPLEEEDHHSNPPGDDEHRQNHHSHKKKPSSSSSENLMTYRVDYWFIDYSCNTSPNSSCLLLNHVAGAAAVIFVTSRSCRQGHERLVEATFALSSSQASSKVGGGGAGGATNTGGFLSLPAALLLINALSSSSKGGGEGEKKSHATSKTYNNKALSPRDGALVDAEIVNVSTERNMPLIEPPNNATADVMLSMTFATLMSLLDLSTPYKDAAFLLGTNVVISPLLTASENFVTSLFQTPA
jgi:hypothetical protein